MHPPDGAPPRAPARRRRQETTQLRTFPMQALPPAALAGLAVALAASGADAAFVAASALACLALALRPPRRDAMPGAPLSGREYAELRRTSHRA